MRTYNDTTTIPAKVWRNFQKYVDLTPEERVELLHDDTIFNSGKEGLALTDQRVLRWEEREVSVYRYEELAEARYVRLEITEGLEVDGIELTLRDGIACKLSLAGAQQAAIEQMAETIRQKVGGSGYVRRKEHVVAESGAVVKRASFFESALMKKFWEDMQGYVDAEEGMTAFAEGFRGSFGASWLFELLEWIPFLGRVVELGRKATRCRCRIYSTSRRLIVFPAREAPYEVALDQIESVRVHQGVFTGGLTIRADGRLLEFYEIGKSQATSLAKAMKGTWEAAIYERDFREAIVR